MSKTALFLALAAAGTAGVLAVLLGTGTMDRPGAQDSDAPAPSAAVEAPKAPSAPSATGPDTPLVADEASPTAPPAETAEDPAAAPVGTTDKVAAVKTGEAPDPEIAPAELSEVPDPATVQVETGEAAAPVETGDAPETTKAPVETIDEAAPSATPVETVEAPDPAVTPVEITEAPAPALAPTDMADVPDPATAPIALVETPEAQAAPVETARGPGALNPEPAPAPLPSVSEPVDSVAAPDAADPAPAESVTLPAPVDSAAAPPAAGKPAPAPAAPEPSDAAPKVLSGPNSDAGTAVAEPLLDGDETILRPSFDVVRAETDGFSLVAGGGQPGAEIEVLVNGEPVETLEVGRDGKFSTFLNLPPDEASVISLRMTGDKSGVVSEDEVIVAPAQVAAADPTPGRLPPTPTPEETVLEREPGAAPAETEEIAAAVTDITTAEAADAAPAPLLESGEPRAGEVPTDPATTPEQDLAALDLPEPEAGTAPASLAAPGAGGVEPTPPEGEAGPVAAEAEVLRLDPGQASRVPAEGTDPGVPPVVGAVDPSTLAAPAPRDGDAPDRPTTGDPAIVARAEPETGAAPDAPRPPAVLLSTPRGVEALSTDPISPGDVALDSISYDEEGDVLLSGRGKTSDFVRIYLDNTPVTTSRIREDGRWRVQLPEVDQGTYVLRVDQVNERGEVTARVESPFLRESTAVLERAVASGGGGFSTVTIQPGNTLWGISRERYGEGMQYVRIFEANRDRIRDPDLIYPGQLFDLPGGATD